VQAQMSLNRKIRELTDQVSELKTELAEAQKRA
jgi:hypothetical protein